MRSGIGQPGVAFIFLGQEVQCPEGYLPGPNLPLGWTFLLLWFPTSVISSFSVTIVSGFRFTNLLSPAGNFLVIDGTTCNINLLPLKSVCLHGRGYYVSQRNASQTHKSLKAKQKSKQTALQREHYPAGPFKTLAMSVTAQGRGRHCTFTNQSLLLSPVWSLPVRTHSCLWTVRRLHVHFEGAFLSGVAALERFAKLQ